MQTVFFDVLPRIIERLSLKQMFQLLAVNKYFHEASILTLKKEDKLVAKSHNDPNLDFPESTRLSKSTECFMKEHVINERSSLPFEAFEEDRVADFILNHLPGLKVAFFEDFPENFMQRLSDNCPLLECLTFENGWKYRLYLRRLPMLKHFSIDFDDFSIRQLSECFPSLTCLSIDGHGLNQFMLKPSDLIEGLKTIQMQNLDMNWNSALSSKAMKTVEHLTMSYGAEEQIQELPGEMPQLKKLIIIEFHLYPESFTNLCLFVRQSQKLEVLNLKRIGNLSHRRSLEIPVQTLDLMCHLREVSLPNLWNISQVITAICRNCPQIEQLSTMRMSDTGRNEVLEKITQMKKLIRLEIINVYGSSFTLEELKDFAALNTKNGDLRFTFNLHQNVNFPLSDSKESFTDFYGIQWKRDIWFDNED